MNIKEALKAALDGKKIKIPQYKNDYYLFWSEHSNCFMDSEMCSKTYFNTNEEEAIWEIVHEPVKYSVDVWFGETPKCDPEEHDLLGLVFGWSSYSSTKYNGFKKYRVTVEEVAEDK